MPEARVTRSDLTPYSTMPRVAARTADVVDGITVGEWSLSGAAFTDRHSHAEINVVVEGELHVTCHGEELVLGPGDRVVVPAGELARYAAPSFARMVYVYGPGPAGMTDVHYEQLSSGS